MSQFKQFMSCLSRALLLGFFGNMITSHGRRVLFIVSVHCQFLNVRELDKELLEKLNRVMRLAQDKNALLLPAYMHGFIWDNRNLEEAIQLCKQPGHCTGTNAEEHIREVAETIVDKAPPGTRYARRQDMVNDLIQLLQYQRSLAIA